MSDLSDSNQLVGVCPSCSAQYPCRGIRILDRKKDRTYFHMTCDQCFHAMIFAIMKRHTGVVCSGMITDCSFDDAERSLAQETVSIDDVIEIHEALKGPIDKLIPLEKAVQA